MKQWKKSGGRWSALLMAALLAASALMGCSGGGESSVSGSSASNTESQAVSESGSQAQTDSESDGQTVSESEPESSEPVEVRIAALHVEGVGVVHDVQLVEHVGAPHRIIVIHCQVDGTPHLVFLRTDKFCEILYARIDVDPQAVTVGEVGTALVAQASLLDVKWQLYDHLSLPAVGQTFHGT